MNILCDYDNNLYIASCDEAYLKYVLGPTSRSLGHANLYHSITKYMNDHNLTADDCVQQMRERVHKETDLTASAGIAPNVVSILLFKTSIV